MVIENKKINDFEILAQIEAGVVLTGSETKAFYLGQVDLSKSHVRILGGKPVLVNAQFNHPSLSGEAATRSRALLMHKREIADFVGKLGKTGLTVVAIRMYNKGRFVKVLIGLARGLKEYGRREKLKNRDLLRQAQRDLVNE